MRGTLAVMNRGRPSFNRTRRPADAAATPDRAEPQPQELIGKSISSIKPQARDAMTVLIRVRGKRGGLLSLAEANTLNLRVGDLWSEQLAQRCRAHEAISEVRTAALRLLTRAAQTKAGLLRKLKHKRLDPALCTRVVTELEDRGLINDQLFADTFAQSRSRGKPMGARLALAKLAQKGIDRTTAQKAVSEHFAHRDDHAEALRLLHTKLRRGTKPTDDRQALKRRLIGLLSRRGFDSGVCIKAVNEAMKALP
jgi:regulatory protein